MTDETEARLHALIDPTAAAHDPMYAMTLDLFRQWLRLTEMALDDEGVDSATTQRALNRITYGAPYAADAKQRMDQDRKALEDLERRTSPTMWVKPGWMR